MSKGASQVEFTRWIYTVNYTVKLDVSSKLYNSEVQRAKQSPAWCHAHGHLTAQDRRLMSCSCLQVWLKVWAAA